MSSLPQYLKLEVEKRDISLKEISDLKTSRT